MLTEVVHLIFYLKVLRLHWEKKNQKRFRARMMKMEMSDILQLF